MPSCNTYHPIWVSLTLDVGHLFTAAPAKCSCCSLPWTRDISSWPPLLTLKWTSYSLLSCTHTAAARWRWGSSSRAGPLTSGMGISSRPCPWPRACGSSSRLPPLTSDVQYNLPISIFLPFKNEFVFMHVDVSYRPVLQGALVCRNQDLWARCAHCIKVSLIPSARSWWRQKIVHTYTSIIYKYISINYIYLCIYQLYYSL